MRLGELYPVVPLVGSRQSSQPTSTFKYYKLHGSINQHYAGFYSHVPPWGAASDTSQDQPLELLGNTDVMVVPSVFDKSIYLDNEYMRRLWHDAGRKLFKAKRVFVIGYSLPPSDLGMRFFFAHSQPASATRWHIIDIDEKVSVRYKRLLKPKQDICGKYAGIDDPLPRFVDFYATSQ